ncbi:MAG: 5-formyltetrahydrofolate cyclo-ligase [Comamonadaceae bacterium]|nr:MAG: 5-formyltetrahydrofolate cyclo-ligase [Comamonadaceae bacterium]
MTQDSQAEFPESSAVHVDKAQVRDRILRERKGLSTAEHRQQSQAIVEMIFGMDAFRHARVVVAYCSFGSEMDTVEFIAEVHRCGKTLVLPRINKKMNCLDLYLVGTDKDALVDGPWGIREPNPATCKLATAQSLDLVLAPGVAFDPQGGRVGYGKGYYDKLLRSCLDLGATPWIVAGAFDLQLLERVPMQAHDIFVHGVLTESRCIICPTQPPLPASSSNTQRRCAIPDLSGQ